MSCQQVLIGEMFITLVNDKQCVGMSPCRLTYLTNGNDLTGWVVGITQPKYIQIVWKIFDVISRYDFMHMQPAGISIF